MARKKKPKKSVDEKISEALDIAASTDIVPSPHKPQSAGDPVEGEVVDAEIVVAESQPLALGYPTLGENPDIEADYEATRKQLESVTAQAEEALEQMKDVAEQSQQARCYEVVGQLVKMNLEAAKAKIELHKDMKALRGQEGSKSSRSGKHIGDVNQSIFVGTTKDLQDMQKAGKLPDTNEKK